MADKLNEVAKTLGLTKRNAEYAVKRSQAIHPRIERVRDIFDETIPFEMEFDTLNQDSSYFMDLFFNKPPPLKNCEFGRYAINCNEYTLEAGDHLIQVTARYKPGSVSVFRNYIRLTPGVEFYEYDPAQGLVWVQGAGSTVPYTICFIRDTWVTCPPDYAALIFESFGPSFIGAGASSSINTTGDDGAAFAETSAGTSTGSVIWLLAPDDLPDTLPSVDNFRVTCKVSLEGSGFRNTADLVTTDASITYGLGSIQWRIQIGNGAGVGAQQGSGIYYSSTSSWTKLTSIGDEESGAGVVEATIDRNLARGSTKLIIGGFEQEFPAGSPSSITTAVSFSFSTLGSTDTPDSEASGALLVFELGCSLEP